MARYDKHQDLEFEFIINSDISIVSEMGKKSLKIDYNTNIIAYQNWSIKTKSLNNGERAVFNYTCDKLIEAAARLANMNKSYEPSVIMSYKNSNNESIHLVFSANNLRIVEDKRDSNLYMFMDVTDKLHSDFIPEAGNYQNVRLNLSTMPYHVMGVNMSLLPPSNNNEEVHTSNHHFEKPPFSFLLNTTVSSISTVNGVSQIRVPSNTLLYAYEQWSVNHEPLEDRDRILKTLTWQKAKENVEEYNSKFQNSAFTPTVFIEINEKQYLGVITSLEIEDGHAVLSVETNRMAMKQNGQSSPLPSLPESLVEGTKIFMNIDDTPTTSVVHLPEVLARASNDPRRSINGVSLAAGEIMELNVLDNFLSLPSGVNKFVNHGTINLSVMSDLKESKDVTATIARANKSVLALMRSPDDEGELIFENHGKIFISVYKEVNANILGQVIYGKGANQRIHNYGSIYVEDQKAAGEDKDVDRDIIIRGDMNNHFSFINAPVYNQGVIRFDKIINKAPIIVVGIEEVFLNGNQSMHEARGSEDINIGNSDLYGTDSARAGTILFEKIQSDLDFSNSSLDGLIKTRHSPLFGHSYPDIVNQTVGIKKVKNMVRSSILFKQIIVGNKDDTGKSLIEGTNLNMSAYGIFCMGDVDGEDFNKASEIYNLDENGETIDYFLTNPNYDGYGQGQPDDDEWDNRTETTETISGVGEGGFIYIDSVENYSPTANRDVLTAVGICNLIQTHQLAHTFIHNIINNGYGGGDACMGICNVLVNYGQIQITNVKNISKLPFHSYHSEEHNVCYGIRNVVQNGFTEIFDDKNIKNEERAKLQRACLPPFPPAYYDINGEPNQIESYTALKKFNIDRLDELISQSIYDKFNFSVDFNPFYSSFNSYYKQGHISIANVVSECIMNELAIGINTYGGFAFNSSITNVSKFNEMGSTVNRPIGITRFMQRYVKKYTGLSTVWSYPTNSNTSWQGLGDSATSNLLNSFFSDRQGNLDGPGVQTELENNGWYWEFNNPVQMYYKYIQGSDLLSNIIFFPMNWGIVTINYVMAGGYEPLVPDNDTNVDNDVKGSAIGIRKLYTAMGPIQIDNIESNIQQEQYDQPLIKTKESTLVNTNDYPEITQQFYPSSSEEDTVGYMDLPIKYIHGYGVEEVYGQSINDLPIILTMDSGDIADVENRIEGIWSTGTLTYNNYCWPYQLINKHEVNGEIEFSSHTSLTDEFKFSNESGKTFNVPANSSAKNLLQLLQSPGAAYGVLRTIDYGSNAPGLGFLKSWTQPIESRPYEGDVWNNARECMGYVSDPERVVGKDDDELVDADGQPIGNLLYGTIAPADIKIIPKHIQVPSRSNYNYALTPQTEDSLTRTEQLHYDIVRGPLGGANQSWIGDYLHYPFKPRLNQLGLDPDSNGTKPYPGDTGSASYIDGDQTKSFVHNSSYSNNNGIKLFNGSANIWNKLPSVYPLYQFQVQASDVTGDFYQFFARFEDFTGADFFVRDYGLNPDYIGGVDSGVNNPWIGVVVQQEYSRDADGRGNAPADFMLETEDAAGELRNIIEKPVRMGIVDSVFSRHKTIDYSQFEFAPTSTTGDSSMYIYNSDYLTGKVFKYDYDNLYSSPYTLPNMDNFFNGLAPFPFIKSNQYIQSKAPMFINQTYNLRTFQDYIPLCEKILWNPMTYKVSNPFAYHIPYTPLVQANVEIDKYLLSSAQNKKELWRHDAFLKNIYPFLIQEEDIGVFGDGSLKEVEFPQQVKNGLIKMPSHFHILHSRWPYDEALKQFNKKYYGLEDDNLNGAGRSGPNHSTYFSPDHPDIHEMRSPGTYDDMMAGGERLSNTICLANFLSYNYSSTKPVGFNPHLIRGGYWNLESTHPHAEDIKSREYGGSPTRFPGFSVVSKGKKYIKSLDSIDPDLQPKIITKNRIMTHESNFIGKYQTNNRYYGFVYENRNSKAKFDFLSYEMVEGPYTRYRDLLQLVTNQIYLNGADISDFNSKLKDNREDEIRNIKDEKKQREIRQATSAWNLGGTALLMIGLHFITHA